MTSHPPGDCCTVGVKHEGTAKGEFTELNGVPAYITYPASKSTDQAIFFLPDVIGYKFINAQLVADSFAEAGFFVAMPDLWEDDPVPPADKRPEGWQLSDWLSKHTFEKTQPILDKAFEGFQSKYSPKRIGTIGICLGAKYACFIMASSAVRAGVWNHPSWVIESELEKIQSPLLINAAETDTIFTTELRHKSEEILKNKGATYQIALYSGTEHGFSIRGDLSNKSVTQAKEMAFQNAANWFKRFLAL